MNPFAEKYKTLSIAQLLEIIDTPENYQPLAIAAAEDELLARNVSIAEMTESRAENELRANEKDAKIERKRAFEDKLVNAANSAIETIHPVQKTPASANRVILLISIVFAIFGLVHLYRFAYYIIGSWHMIYHMRVSLIFPYLFQGLFLAGTAFLFWKRMKWGWIFLGVYTNFSAAGAVIAIFISLWKDLLRPGMHYGFYASAIPSFLFTGLFYGCCTWFLYKFETREIYKIDKYLSIIVAAAGVFLGLLVFVLIAA
jgi:hypothetical protein